MPPTIAYRFGDVVLVPFPFTDQSGSKRRPAVVVSSDAYAQHRRDLIIMAVTSQVSNARAFAEVTIREWRTAGLLKPSMTKPVVASIQKGLVRRKLGHLDQADCAAVRDALREILG